MNKCWLNKKHALALSLLIGSMPLLAQKKPVIVDAGRAIEEALRFVADEKFDSALSVLATVHFGDTAYLLAQYEMSLVKLKKQDFDGVVRLSQQLSHEKML